MKRLATAAVLLPLTWVVCVYASLPVFTGVVAALAALACRECCTILAARGAPPVTAVAVATAGVLSAALAGLPPWLAPGAVVAGGAIAACVAAMVLRDGPAAMLDAAVSTVFAFVVVGGGLGHLAAVRARPGAAWVGLLILCVIGADSFAYYAGRALGRRPLWPALSPKKTWEGAAGGLLGALAGALVARAFFLRSLPPVHAAGASVAIFVAALFGDLAESMIKRAGGVKDSSSVLPGHGGFLDRLDSLLFAAPVLYYYWWVFFAE